MAWVLELPFYPEPRGVIQVSASAGSGKTYRLALQYLRVLASLGVPREENLPSVVALTFTNQAAAEINGITAKQLLRLQHMLAVSERAKTAHMAEENARQRARAHYHDYLMQGWGERSTATPLSDFP